LKLTALVHDIEQVDKFASFDHSLRPTLGALFALHFAACEFDADLGWGHVFVEDGKA